MDSKSPAEAVSEHTKRPWGQYYLIYSEKGMWVKTIEIYPGKRLSLQIHLKRSEHWHSSDYGLKAEIGDETVDLVPGMVYTVPVGTPHRLYNPTGKKLFLTEIAFGEPDESDIIRIQDDYGRSDQRLE